MLNNPAMALPDGANGLFLKKSPHKSQLDRPLTLAEAQKEARKQIEHDKQECIQGVTKAFMKLIEGSNERKDK